MKTHAFGSNHTESTYGHNLTVVPNPTSRMEEVAREIGCATKTAKGRISKYVFEAFGSLQRFLDEGAEIHNRHRQAVETHYMNNWHHIRSIS